MSDLLRANLIVLESILFIKNTPSLNNLLKVVEVSIMFPSASNDSDIIFSGV